MADYEPLLVTTTVGLSIRRAFQNFKVVPGVAILHRLARVPVSLGEIAPPPATPRRYAKHVRDAEPADKPTD
jgi:hypothetical protein